MGSLGPVGGAAAHDVRPGLQAMHQGLHPGWARVGSVREAEAPNGQHRPSAMAKVGRGLGVSRGKAIPVCLDVCEPQRIRLERYMCLAGSGVGLIA